MGERAEEGGDLGGGKGLFGGEFSGRDGVALRVESAGGRAAELRSGAGGVSGLDRAGGQAEMAERNGVWIGAEGAGFRVWQWGLRNGLAERDEVAGKGGWVGDELRAGGQ